MRMKTKIVSGATISAAAVALVLAGVAPAGAKARHRHHHNKPAAHKMACGGKNSCPSKVKEEKGAEPKAPAYGK